MPPAISVVIPLYNKRPYIERCLQSVRNQTFTDYQIVVVNDGSTDGGEELVKTFLGAGDLLINQVNSGEGAARNRGFEEARADIVALPDPDDEWLPSRPANMSHLSEHFPEAGLFATGLRFRYVCPPGLLRDIGLAGVVPRAVNYFANAGKARVCCSSSVAVAKEAFRSVGGFSADRLLGVDAEFWAKFALRWQLVLHPDVTRVYHQNPDRASYSLCAAGAFAAPVTCRTLEAAVRNGSVCREDVADVEAYPAELRIGLVRGLIEQQRCAEASRLLRDDALQCPQMCGEVRRLRTANTVVSCFPPVLFGAFLWFARFARRHSKQVFTRTYGDIIVRQYYADRDAPEA